MNRLGWRAVAVFLLGGVALLVALRAWQGDAYWSYSDGVYALTARLVLHGHALYRDVAAAQPPPVFYAGTLLLAVADSLDALRVGLSVVNLVTAALVLAATWRLTARRVPAVVAGLLALVTPLALHDHALLTPETLAAPLVLGAALLGARPGRAAALGGVLGALAAACKLAYALPAIGLVVAVRRRGYLGRARVALGAAAATALLGAVEIGSLLASPSDPALYGRPFAASAPGWVLGAGAVHRRVVVARACPHGAAYSGPPYLAFLAGRRMPGDQPDQFILLHASTYRGVAASAARDEPRCP